MNTDKVLGAGLIALGILGTTATLQISVRTFNDDPGPQLFPILGFAILILSGLGMLVAKGSVAEPASRASLLRGLVMAGLMVVFSVGLWLLGYYVATPVMVYAFYHVIAGPDRRSPIRGAIYAVAVTGGVHLVFAEFLNTLLPQGRLF